MEDDEPTNHLDAEGRACVARYLASKKGFIIISHDRTFIDEVVDHVLSINKANIEIQKGNFSTWLVNKERRDGFEKAENEKLQKEVKRLQDAAKQKAGWSDSLEATKIGSGACDRGFIGHKAAKMMKRAKCIEARQNKAIVEKSKLLKNIEVIEELKLNNLVSTQEEVLKVQDLQVVYDDVPIFQPLSFDIKRGERIWLYGKNGCGKSSIIKVLLGENIKHTGFIQKTAKVSYIAQDTSSLKGTINHFITNNQLNNERLKNTLYKLGLEENQFQKHIEEWSEGQKKKLLIAKSLCEEAELYIWDEPLNFIDVISYMQIEELLCKEKPTMLFVEHDESFGNRIATKKIRVE
ncbi:MAG: ATP-binding cassette domain-containing protein [Cellulosilyticaceae bacterium]